MTPGFSAFALGDGLQLFVQPTKKFKTVALYVYLHTPLHEDTVTANALLPMVMVRGTENFPTTPELTRHLDDLFGAGLGYDVARRGEGHSLLFALTLPDEGYLSGATGLLERGVQALAEIVMRPALVGGGLRPDYVEQERRNLEQMIESLVNDKRRYALQRCRELLCAGEPYSIYHLGRVADLASVTPESLYAHHQQVLQRAAIDIFAVGDVDPEQVRNLVVRHFNFPSGSQRARPTTVVRRVARPTRAITEAQPVNQGVLALGWLTGTAATDAEYFPMVVANGILGGFAHSKLFANVREKNSLAYYAYSSVDGLKGVGFIYAGIEFDNYQKALDISLEQLQDLQQGAVTEQEYFATIKALASDALSVQDSPGRLVEQYLNGLLSGRLLTPKQRAAAYEQVTLEQAVAAARGFQVETIYFLTKGEE